MKNKTKVRDLRRWLLGQGFKMNEAKEEYVHVETGVSVSEKVVDAALDQISDPEEVCEMVIKSIEDARARLIV